MDKIISNRFLKCNKNKIMKKTKMWLGFNLFAESGVPESDVTTKMIEFVQTNKGKKCFSNSVHEETFFVFNMEMNSEDDSNEKFLRRYQTYLNDKLFSVRKRTTEVVYIIFHSLTDNRIISTTLIGDNVVNFSIFD